MLELSVDYVQKYKNSYWKWGKSLMEQHKIDTNAEKQLSQMSQNTGVEVINNN
jgi:hypothetical protein